MKPFGIILIVIGIILLITPGLNITKKEKVVDVGPVEVSKKEKKFIKLPFYVGAIVTATGVFVLLAGKRK
jgi:hypothetical protein